MERKLAAILSADVKGYSRLMGEDDEATIRTLTAYREVMTSLIEQHHGRVVDSPGDNLLAEFASAVNAVQGAVAIQKELRTRNRELPANRQMAYRIGVNLGDVVADDGRLYGDGVNIAARLESLAEAGGICISGKVFDEVKTKLALGYDYIGEQEVKNIAEPVRAYKVQLDSDETAPPTVSQKPPPLSPSEEKSPSRRWSIAALALGAVLVMGAGVFVLRDFSLQLSPPQESISLEEAPALPFPDKPSIAVLPFINMSDDPEQDYFSDGMTEDLITDLSKISGLFVIARNSVFTYKGKAVQVEEVGRELGVRYVLEGSTRKADSRVRINAQLVDATTGGYVWAERYDRELKDVFALQDEITQKIILALRVEVREAERERVRRIPTDNLNAYDSYLRGLEYFYRYTKEANARAQQMYERAIELDPQYAGAYALLGATHFTELAFQWSQDPQSLERAFELVQKALALDDSLPAAHGILGYVYLWKKQYEQAIAEGEKAISLDPNNADAYATLGRILNWAGRPEEGIRLVKKAMRLNPRYPPRYSVALGGSYCLLVRTDEAIAIQKRVITRNPDNLFARICLAACYGNLGRAEEARAEVTEVLRLSPNFSLEVWSRSLPHNDLAGAAGMLEGLRKAGLK